MKTKTLLTLAMAALLGYSLYLGQRGSSLLGSQAGDFALPSSRTGGLVRLSDFQGQWVLLNFWASWCPPCVREMPSLESLKSRMEGKGLKVVAVSVDDGWPDIERFLERLPLTMTVLYDAGGRVAATYGAFTLPQTYLIDPKGLIIKDYQGPRDWEDAEIVSEIEGYVQDTFP